MNYQQYSGWNQSSIDYSLRDRHRFLQQIVTGDEKWVLYVDHTRKCQWVNPEDLPEPEPKNYLHPCCHSAGIFTILSTGNFYLIDAQFYCQQVEELELALQVNRPERRKIHDNARDLIQEKLHGKSWKN